MIKIFERDKDTQGFILWMPFFHIGLTQIRINKPCNSSAWRYFRKNPKSLIVGVYGLNRFVEQRDKIQKLQSELLSLKNSIKIKNEKLSVLGKELSKIKRSK